MKKKVAIFVDWDNLRKDIAKLQNYSKHTNEQSIIDFQKNFDYNNSSHIIKLIEAFLENDEEIYRIFFYTAKPKNINEIPDVYKTEQDKNNYRKYEEKINNFLKEIAVEPYIALRLGTIQYGNKLSIHFH